jgi:hypothetical protein
MNYLKLIPYGVMALALFAAMAFRTDAIAEKARADGEKARADLAVENTKVAIDANEIQKAAIADLRTAAAKQDILLSNITRQLAAINQNVIDTNDAVSELEAHNDKVREYLLAPVPLELLGVLNRKGD